MTRSLIFVFFIFLSISSSAQTIEWASEVKEVSSELTPTLYGAKQALGKPNVSLKGGDNPNAWSPRRSDRTDFIKVGFANPMRIQQIAIHESYNPGSVYQVYTYDGQDNEYLMFTLEPRDLPLDSRLLNIFFEMTTHDVHAVKVVIDGSKVPNENSIDAIGISDSNIPISVTIKIAENVNTEIETERLSDNVNSPYVEHSPILSPDGKTLFFSRQNHPDNVGGEDDYEDIWYSELDDETGEWKEAKNLGTRLNTQGPNFISSISADGNNLVLLLGNRYTKDGRMKAGVSVSNKLADGTWSEPTALEIENDYNYSPKSDYFMGDDKEVLIMSVERDDTYGFRDLYVSFRQADSTWSEPLNLGDVVNTASEESAPFLDKDMKTLYFSSDGFSGFGGTDIYVTKRLDDTWTNWSEPENMGPGINSDGDDIYFNLPTVGDYGYLTKGERDLDADIFRFQINDLYKKDDVPLDEEEMLIVKGKVINSTTGKPMAATVIFDRMPDGTQIGSVKTDPATGAYTFEVPKGGRYAFRAESDGFIAVSEEVDINQINEDGEMISELRMQPVAPKVELTLSNVFFAFASSELTTSSIPDLERIHKYIKDGQIVKIKISGHTDSTGPEDYNLLLSKQRAQRVAKFFTDKGVDASKVQVEWFGETQPLVPNTSVENRKKNRRVVFTIVE